LQKPRRKADGLLEDRPLLTPILRAIGQLDDPALLGVLLQTLLLSVLCFAGVAGGCFWLVHHWLGPDSAFSWLAGALGSVLAIVSALWLFLPVAVVIASLFMEPVCRAVERRWYPDLPPSKGAGWLPQLLEGLSIALRVLVLSLLSLIASLIVPGLGHVLGWAITAWAIGRGLFVSVALRRLDRRQARAAYRAQRWDVLVQGGLLTLAGTLPLANFLLPVLGPACMVHVLLRGAVWPAGRLGDGRESWG
jgi:uncharacterized protein involved in cysteine biosynthesis